MIFSYSHYNDLDVGEVPICETAISCDNLLCDGNGRPPNPSVVIEVTAQNRPGWIKYGRTEVIEVYCLYGIIILSFIYRVHGILYT